MGAGTMLEFLEPVEGVPMRSYGIAVGVAVSVAAALQMWAVAWAQSGTSPSVESVNEWAALIELAKSLPLPVVLAGIAWWARGAFAQLQTALKDSLREALTDVTVKLSDEDRRLLEDLRRSREG